jgi:hypothetical protein
VKGGTYYPMTVKKSIYVRRKLPRPTACRASICRAAARTPGCIRTRCFPTIETILAAYSSQSGEYERQRAFRKSPVSWAVALLVAPMSPRCPDESVIVRNQGTIFPRCWPAAGQGFATGEEISAEDLAAAIYTDANRSIMSPRMTNMLTIVRDIIRTLGRSTNPTST